MDAEKLMMQKRIDNLIEQLELVKRERDAALWDMQITAIKTLCPICKRHNLDDCFKWRGVQENGGIEK